MTRPRISSSTVVSTAELEVMFTEKFQIVWMIERKWQAAKSVD